MSTGPMQQRSDSSFETVLQERLQEFPLDPLGGYCVGRENQHEPVAPPKRRTDFVVPLLGALDVGFAVPDRDPMATQDIDQSIDEWSIHAGVGDEDFVRHAGGRCSWAQA